MLAIAPGINQQSTGFAPRNDPVFSNLFLHNFIKAPELESAMPALSVWILGIRF